ncbi:hypothetical protein ACIO3O_39965 [Streptomyces sp. NPDC087440]|uniref:hypothetical protein n=1 Tax=Streptomyces sp. NPDC087440 TaxID=3365790 RepID=UPI00381B3092
MDDTTTPAAPLSPGSPTPRPSSAASSPTPPKPPAATAGPLAVEDAVDTAKAVTGALATVDAETARILAPVP